jgi:hypothetical protein
MIAFLREQLNADEIRALAACWKGSGNTPNWHAPFSATLDTGGDTIHVGDQAVTNHIARWDPARVLAEVAAKKRILDGIVSPMDWTPQMKAVVRHLAAVYVDRDGYKPEWAPEPGIEWDDEP